MCKLQTFVRFFWNTLYTRMSRLQTFTSTFKTDTVLPTMPCKYKIVGFIAKLHRQEKLHGGVCSSSGQYTTLMCVYMHMYTQRCDSSPHLSVGGGETAGAAFKHIIPATGSGRSRCRRGSETGEYGGSSD